MELVVPIVSLDPLLGARGIGPAPAARVAADRTRTRRAAERGI